MKTRREFLARTSQGLLGLGAIPAIRMGASSARTSSARTSQSTAQARGTGLVFDERYLDHVLPTRGGAPHPERPLRLRRIREMFAARGLDRELTPIPLMSDPVPSIRRLHTPEHVESVQAIPVTGPVAELTVAGALGGIDAVAQGEVRNVFCAIRPPERRASASTAPLRSPPGMPSKYTASRRSSSSTGTTTTGTAPRTLSTAIPRCSSSRPTTFWRIRAPGIRH